jgi:2'-hydroxyisoflavone reductase
MKILVLGGTQFSGRSFVHQALDADHEVTLLHRSRADPGLPDAVRRLIGDRDPKLGDGLERIRELLDAGERFDAVVDMCGYGPRVVSESAELLKDSVDLYLFVSTISVYDREGLETIDEQSKQLELDDPTVEEVTKDTYGGLKVLCERALDGILGEKLCVVRPGVIAGANDPTDRFTWWTRVLATEDAVVVPTEPAGVTQFIDARDLAAFFLRCVEQRTTGVFNVTGPEDGLPTRAFIDRAHRALGSETAIIEKDPAWLLEQGVEFWAGLPLVLAMDSQNMHHVSSARAIAAGLTRRPLEETVRQTRAWDVERGEPALKAGMEMEKLREVCTAAAD